MSLNVSQHYKARALVFGGGGGLPDSAPEITAEIWSQTDKRETGQTRLFLGGDQVFLSPARMQHQPHVLMSGRHVFTC